MGAWGGGIFRFLPTTAAFAMFPQALRMLGVACSSQMCPVLSTSELSSPPLWSKCYLFSFKDLLTCHHLCEAFCLCPRQNSSLPENTLFIPLFYRHVPACLGLQLRTLCPLHPLDQEQPGQGPPIIRHYAGPSRDPEK